MAVLIDRLGSFQRRLCSLAKPPEAVSKQAGVTGKPSLEVSVVTETTDAERQHNIGMLLC
jgi:hypothetical protein